MKILFNKTHSGLSLFAASISLILVWDIIQVGYFLDDAMIYHTYARNIANGEWSFNVGQNDFATTSTIHSIILAMFHWLSDDAMRLHKAYEAVIYFIGIAMFCFMMLKSGLNWMITLGVVLLFGIDKHLTWFVFFSGMETSILLPLIIMFCFFAAQNNHLAVGIVTFLIFLTRPESSLLGISYFTFYGLYYLQQSFVAGKKFTVRSFLMTNASFLSAGLVCLSLTVASMVVMYLAKGNAIPDSGYAKLLSQANWGTYISRIPMLAKDNWYYFALSPIGFVFVRHKNFRPIDMLVIGCFVIQIFFVTANMPKAPWYYLPYKLLQYGLLALVIETILKVSNKAKFLGIGYLITVIYVSSSTINATKRSIAYERDKLHNFALASEYVNKRYNNDASLVVAAGSIGYVGYHGTFFVGDMVGLLDPEVAKQNYLKNRQFFFDKYKPKVLIQRVRYAKNRKNIRSLKIFGEKRFGREAIGVYEFY